MVPSTIDTLPNVQDPFAFTHMDDFKAAMPQAYNHMQDVLAAPDKAGKAPQPLVILHGAELILAPIDTFTPQHFTWVVPEDVNPLGKWVIQSENMPGHVPEGGGEDMEEDEEPMPVAPPAEKPKPRPKPRTKAKSSVAADEVRCIACAQAFDHSCT